VNASYEWLGSIIPITRTPVELRDIITARCATVDEMVALRDDLSSVVVGLVVEAGKHPNADHLSVTRVDAGTGELLDVVCGAPNVRVGAKYPFAPAGSTLPGGVKLERRKIRGAISNGMLCSARELGLGDEHDGILELDTDATPGTPLLRALRVGDVRFEIDVSPNRPDLLSHAGLAREIAAATGVTFSIPAIGPDGAPVAPTSDAARRDESEPLRWHATGSARDTTGIAGGVKVDLRDPDGCPHYMGVVLRGVTIGPSPDWLVRRLASVGSRSINNVVDVTNYILHELGQPTHVFDAKRLAGPAIVIRRARAGESLTTLDGVRRTLSSDVLVIADGERAQALAGIMGGADSEVSEQTTDLFLEVATFEPAGVRRTRRALGLSTDASYRFERGADPEGPPVALDRAVRMLLALCGGRVDGAPVDLYPRPVAERRVTLRPERASALLGESVTAAEIEALFRPVGLVTGAGEHSTLDVRVPTWRVDVASEVDLIEEVARLRGYDSFPDTLRGSRPSAVPDSPAWTLTNRIRELLVAQGLLEARPMPFVTGDDRTHVRLLNPLADDEAHLRRDVLTTLARRAEYNLARMQRDVRIFELGDVFFPGSSGKPPREVVHVGALIMGRRTPPHWTDEQPADLDEWDAKGIAERLAAAAVPQGVVRLVPAASGEDSGLLWEISIDGATRGEVRRLALDAPAWAAPAFGAELSLLDLAPPHRGEARAHTETFVLATPRRYRPLPVTPAAQFDLALVVADDTPAERVEAVMRTAAGELLESLQLFDEYRGPGLPEGSRSLAWRLTFRHPDRTLSAKEIDGRRERLLRTLEGELGVRQRTS